MYCLRLLLLLGFLMILFSCKKEQGPIAVNPPIPQPTTPARHILLKDIIVPHLPSPYYHFEYNADSMVSKVDFASGYSMYDVLYAENKISELRNHIVVNYDTLRYLYDPTGRLFMISFINQANTVYRHARFTYTGDQIKEIDWDIKDGNIGFFIDRKITFEFYPDNNLKTMVDHRPASNGSPEHTNTTLFEQYDKKINVDDFSIIHDSFHDHLFLLQDFHLQNNNPGKESLSVDGIDLYTVNYTYVYNTDNTPSVKSGAFMYTSGPDSGKVFQVGSIYSYY